MSSLQRDGRKWASILSARLGARSFLRSGTFRIARIRSHVALLVVVVLAGCISDKREEEIGSTMAADVNVHLPIIEDSLLNSYVQTLGQRIGEVSGRPEIEYTFYIVNTDIANAFALPGGHIYLTRGLISRMEDGAEFAGALAHEIGHVAARHGVEKLQRELRTGSLVDVLYNTILGWEPELLGENSLQLAEEIWTARNSRLDEEEADRLAVQYLLKAGIDPNGVVTLLESLLREEQADSSQFGRLETWFLSHPLTESRIVGAREAIEDLNMEVAPVAGDLDGFDQFRELVSSYAPDDAFSDSTFLTPAQ